VLKNWNGAERIKQEEFLARFKASFTSGQVVLLDEPQVQEQQRTLMAETGYASYRGPGVNEYRITAPIQASGRERWAVWSYTCNDCSQDYIYQFSYAEAASPQQLPQFPNPPKPYIEGTWRMIDGVPSTAGATATIVSSTSQAPIDRPITLTASAPPGTMCELIVFPSDAVLTPLTPLAPDARGRVRWTWSVDPRFAGGDIAVQVKCIETRGAARLEATTRGANIRLLPGSSTQ
jgi:hypothetical protein